MELGQATKFPPCTTFGHWIHWAPPLPECLINEVWSYIADDYSWDSIPQEDDFMEHLLWVHSISSRARKSFHPFRDVVDGNQDVFAAFWVRNGPMKSIPQTSKISIWRFKLVHCIPCIIVSVPLTLDVASNKWLGTIKHSGPVESTLPHVSIGAKISIVTPIWWWMRMLKYLPCLKSWYASS
jgi:hypothetical protein